LTPDMLAEIVIANMVHLPSTPPPFYPSVNPAANWGQGNLLYSGPAEIAVNPLTTTPMESAASSQPYPSAADPSRDLRKVCAFIHSLVCDRQCCNQSHSSKLFYRPFLSNISSCA
jgi:hypothetical protein